MRFRRAQRVASSSAAERCRGDRATRQTSERACATGQGRDQGVQRCPERCKQQGEVGELDAANKTLQRPAPARHQLDATAQLAGCRGGLKINDRK